MTTSKQEIIASIKKNYELKSNHYDYLEGKLNIEIEQEEGSTIKSLVSNIMDYGFKTKAEKYCKEHKTNHIEDLVVLDWIVEYANASLTDRKELNGATTNKTIKTAKNTTSTINTSKTDKKHSNEQMTVFDLEEIE